MRCPSCGKENPAAVKCCDACGAALPARCANCDFENPPQFRFCGQCGTRLRGPAAEPAPFERLRPREPERRQITVMFCDLVGSTALSARLDPEELREVVRHYQTLCAAIVSRHEGHIAQYLGDGIMVYFGYPVAHEDDARRAVRAGLDIVAEMQSLRARQNESLAVRVSLHTGLVVIGEMGVGDKRELLALGTAPNIAARLQTLAAPNTVVISSATHHLVQGFFKLQSQGTQLLKGLNAPLAVYRVLYESGAHTRLEAAMLSGLTPLAGKSYSRARTLCERLNQTLRLASAMFGFCKAALVRGDLRQAHVLAQECMLLVETKQDIELLLTAHLALGISAASAGELLTTQKHLRAAMSLSRLWQTQGRSGAAHDLLSGIYGWFTEGFDTADLQEAKTLLAELADAG